MAEYWNSFLEWSGWAWHGWNAVSAISTAGAMLVSSWAVYVAIVTPRRERAEDRSVSTLEVLRAATDAIELFEKAKTFNLNSDDLSMFARLAGQAGHLSVALDRLLNRPTLSDGAIITGAGALQLTGAIIKQYEEYRRPSSNGLARMVPNELAPFDLMVEDVLDRAQRVANYAVKRRWPSWRRRFRDIAKDGLR